MSYENNCDGSFIKMPTSKVAEMAQKTLDWINQYRAEKTQKYIESHRQYMVSGFWHRFWKRPAPSDKEVIKNINNNPWNNFQFIAMSYDITEKTAKRLLIACKQADEIYISTEDLQRIT